VQELVLVVDDERDVLRLVEYNLLEEGFRVITAMTGRDALKLTTEHRPNMIILDLILPDMDGREVCRALKKKSETDHIPIIILSAKASDVDRVVGFELGCDDYLVKPFNYRELILRVRAILRRMNPPADTSGVIQIADLVIDTIKHQVTLAGRPIRLTPTEFRLLVFLVRRRGQVQSRETLMREIWGRVPRQERERRTVDTHIRRLKMKLGLLEYMIRTERKERPRRLRDEDEPGDLGDDSLASDKNADGSDRPYGYVFMPPVEGVVGGPGFRFDPSQEDLPGEGESPQTESI
jgi:two-component system, OmpR family, phosphate regulon response regulator PhoB